MVLVEGDNFTKIRIDKYSGILNDGNDAPDKEDLMQMLADSPRGQIKFRYLCGRYTTGCS